MNNKDHEEYFEEELGIDVTNFIEILTKTSGNDSITEYKDTVDNITYYACDSGGHFHDEDIPDGFIIRLPEGLSLSQMNENQIYKNTNTSSGISGAQVNFTKNGEWGSDYSPQIVEVWLGVHDFPTYFDGIAENISVLVGNLTMKQIKDKFTAIGLNFDGYKEFDE